MRQTGNAEHILSSNHPILYLPLEVTRREFFGRLLIAVEAADRGFLVFFGHKNKINRLAAENSKLGGIYFAKSVPNPSDSPIQELRQSGVKIVAQDEETPFIFPTYETWFQHRKSTQSMRTLDRFFCWGEEEATYLKNHFPDIHDKIFTTGAPRTSFWGEIGRAFFASEMAELRTPGEKLLVFVSNLAAVNSFMGRRKYIQYRLRIGRAARDIINRISQQQAQMEMAKDILRGVAETPGWRVLIRPHPSEIAQTWERFARTNEKIAVSALDDVTPAVLAADIVLHTGSSTGIQALVSGIPTTTIVQHSVDNVSDIHSRKYRSLRDLMKSAEEDSSKDLEAFLRSKVLHAGTNRPPKLIVEELTKLSSGRQGKISIPKLLVLTSHLSKWLSAFIAMLHVPPRYLPVRLATKIQKEIFFSLPELRDAIAKSSKLLGLHDNFQVDTIAPGILALQLKSLARSDESGPEH